jgi:cytochrome P450
MRASVPDVDLGALDFWGQPAERRDEYFGWLREEAPISRHEPPETISGERAGGHFWAVVRYEDVRRVSRDAASFCAGQGTHFGKRPKELMERRQSFPAMDAPRHGKLRGLVSAAFTPRQVARIEEQMLGVAAADRERVMRVADMLVSYADPDTLATGDPIAPMRDAIGTVTGFAIELAAHRERHPGEDLMIVTASCPAAATPRRVR